MAWLDKYFTSKNYGTIQDEGADVAPQPTLDFVGTGVSVTNDDANAKSIVTITAGGGSVDFDAVKDALAAANTAVDFNGQALTGLDDPTNAQDAATKAYVDASAGSVTASSTTTFTNKSISGSTNTLTNVAISTAVSGLGANVATFLGTPSSANLAAAITDETGSGALVFGTSPTIASPTISSPSFGSSNLTTTGNILAAGYFYTGSGNVASAGNVRLQNTHSIRARNAANSADVCFAQYSVGDTLYIGLDSGFASQAFSLIQGASFSMYFAVASNYYIHLESSEVRAGYPIVGDATAYGVHGQVTSAHTDANYTVPSGEYKYYTIKFNTACSAGRTITFPAPGSDAAAYEKEVVNGSGQTLTFTTGAGATKTLATGLAVKIRFTSSEGCKYASDTYTP